jgi:dTDP-glucose 4,6-dehydratase
MAKRPTYRFKDCILVTGAGGFIASHFIKKWWDTHDNCLIVALDQSPTQFAMNIFPQFAQLDFSYGDLVQSREEVAKMTNHAHVLCVRGKIGDRAVTDAIFHSLQPSIVFNFAAESHVDRSIDNAAPFIDSNVVQLQSLLESFRVMEGLYKRKPLFVQISTDEVYGDWADDDYEMTEDEQEFGFDIGSRLRPSSPYAASKAMGDLLVKSYGRTFGIDWMITRSSNNYGTRQAPEKLIPLMISKAIAGEPLPVYGNGKQMRDWLHVSDNVNLIMRLAENANAHGFAWNVGYGPLQTNIDVVELIMGLTDSKSEIVQVADRPGHDRVYRINSEVTYNMAECRPEINFMGGMGDTVQWYKDNPNWIERMKESGYSTDRAGLGDE